jgi:hypothetical protein
MDGDTQSLLLPNEHHQLFATSDPRINEVALEQHVVLRGLVPVVTVFSSLIYAFGCLQRGCVLLRVP